MKLTNSALISILGLISLTFLGYRGVDVATSIAGIVSAYVLGRAGLKGSNVWAASKDVDADTITAIKEQEGKGR
jgi:hypothetical protein